MNNETNSKYENSSINIDAIHDNTSQEVLVITIDKLRLRLADHLTNVAKSHDWQAAFGVLLTLTVSLLTSGFKETFGVSAEIWRALFIVGAILSFAWLIKTLVQAFKTESLEVLIRKIKSEQ